MRTNEERISAMHRRAAELKREKIQRRVRLISSAGICICLAAIILLAVCMPGVINIYISESTFPGMNASIFNGSSFLGFAIIGFVSFLLGVSVTVLCFRLKKWQDLEDEEGL
jgi:hypothetical protein